MTEQQLLYYVVQIVSALVIFPASTLESAILPGALVPFVIEQCWKLRSGC